MPSRLLASQRVVVVLRHGHELHAHGVHCRDEGRIGLSASWGIVGDGGDGVGGGDCVGVVAAAAVWKVCWHDGLVVICSEVVVAL